MLLGGPKAQRLLYSIDAPPPTRKTAVSRGRVGQFGEYKIEASARKIRTHARKRVARSTIIFGVRRHLQMRALPISHSVVARQGGAAAKTQ